MDRSYEELYGRDDDAESEDLWNTRAIPPTHRVVSADDLNTAAGACEDIGWDEIADKLRAIIDNKGE